MELMIFRCRLGLKNAYFPFIIKISPLPFKKGAGMFFKERDASLRIKRGALAGNRGWEGYPARRNKRNYLWG
ncbi:MAG: hypothetical protein AB1847_15725 [bacterium]